MLVLASLSACASGPQRSTSATFERFQSEIIVQRNEGKITPVQAQLELWSKYRELYGEDPVINGYYAYSLKVLSAAAAGKLSQDEAQAIVDARESEVTAHRMAADEERNRFFDPYGIPP